MERWTFLILADPAGQPVQIRVFLRAGDDETRWPVAQIGVDGSDVPVDEADKDYEAPEWKALEILRAHGATEDRWEGLKNRLRERGGWLYLVTADDEAATSDGSSSP